MTTWIHNAWQHVSYTERVADARRPIYLTDEQWNQIGKLLYQAGQTDLFQALNVQLATDTTGLLSEREYLESRGLPRNQLAQQRTYRDDVPAHRAVDPMTGARLYDPDELDKWRADSVGKSRRRQHQQPLTVPDIKPYINRPANGITATEISQMFGVVPSAVTNWAKRDPTFPKPIVQEGKLAFYDHDDVLAWAQEYHQRAYAPDGTTPSLQPAQQPENTMTLTEFAQEAGTSQQNVSNWINRSPDFPKPVGTMWTGGRPLNLYDRNELMTWLRTSRPTPRQRKPTDQQQYIKEPEQIVNEDEQRSQWY
jgi:predicted DNA-binding transcriptional regulator AlpA